MDIGPWGAAAGQDSAHLPTSVRWKPAEIVIPLISSLLSFVCCCCLVQVLEAGSFICVALFLIPANIYSKVST